jgi:hypothetical protein
VLARPGAYGELNRRVALRERRERGLEERVHAFRGSPPVAIVELEAFALENEGADAILWLLVQIIERGIFESVPGPLRPFLSLREACWGSRAG